MRRGKKDNNCYKQKKQNSEKPKNQVITVVESKINCKSSSERSLELFPLGFFEINKVEFIIKYRTCVFEEGQEQFLIPDTPGIINLSEVKLLRGGFFSRMAFKECSPGLITSSNHFSRWIRIRNVFFIDAMLFIKQGLQTYCLFEERGPLYIPLQNGSYYELMRKLKLKK